MGTTGPQTILVDGYNVIRNTPGLARAEAASLEHGRATLIERLIARYRHTPHRVVVVFDGDGVAESVQHMRGLSRGQVIFTQRGETADEVIRRMAAACAFGDGAEAATQTVVVSDDSEVRLGVAAHGATTARVGELAQRISEGPRYLTQQARHRAFVRQQLATDADDEDARQHPRKGTSHRPPRRRGAPPDPRW